MQFIFFDGEEAFMDWTATDSLYGSRNYAKVLKQRYQTRGFDSMEAFVLLDLIGADVSAFPNFFPAKTGYLYKLLSQMENNLNSKKMLKRGSAYFFTDASGFGQYSPVEDDHKPFEKEGCF